MDLDAVFSLCNTVCKALVSLRRNSHQQARHEQTLRQSADDVSAQKRGFLPRVPMFNRCQFHRHPRKIMPEINIAGRVDHVLPIS